MATLIFTKVVEKKINEDEATTISQYETDQSPIKVGIFFAKTDVDIAKAIERQFKERNCLTHLFDFVKAGISKLELISNFITDHDIILWIATRTSLHNDGVLQVARHMAQNAHIDKNVHFICFQPKDHLYEKLPLSFSAYTTLIEDKMLDERLDATLNSIRKILKKSCYEKRPVAFSRYTRKKICSPCSDLQYDSDN